MYLFREPVMPMLTLSKEEKPIPFRAFKSPLPGHTYQGFGTRTLGTRKRFAAGDVVKPRYLKEEPVIPAGKADEVAATSHRLILWTPPKDDSEGRQEVVVDPLVSKVLREHQRIGVQFLFDCLMGLKNFDGYGCILADDMGLGKTLQSVTIIWTLLTQGGPQGKAACRKALVVCPASLVKNWEKEFTQWLNGRCKVTAIAESGTAKVSGSMSCFRYDRESKVLIASYETFRGHASEVADAGIDLVVCDEAHKLKNEDSAITKCISRLSATRRLLISGTPIQNNLEEFFTLVSVANPGVFGDINAFRRKFANPILRGREPTASADERQEAQEKLQQVSEVTEEFILRRTNRLNARFLPPKQLFNVFVAPSIFQKKLYHCFLRSNVAKKVLHENAKLSDCAVLVQIKRLQNLVNHPSLVRSKGHQKPEAGFDDDEARSLWAQVDAQDQGLRSNERPVHEELSGKLQLLHSILVQIKASGSGDRIVIISNWTSTLDLVDKMCVQNGWPTHRLDGSMAIGKRMKLVTDFNRADNPKAFAFLLSSKAGGCGLNLIGANRLVMYDPDWNPANDRQAMARIWRDGQKKPCFIYRLFTTGTIDEKVYQRQICKDGLSTMMVTETGEEEHTNQLQESLAADLVKDLFSFSEDTTCATHDMLECKRCPAHLQAGRVSGVIDVGDEDLSRDFVPQETDVVEDELNTWSHHPKGQGVPDTILKEAAKMCKGRGVTFAMGCHIEYTAEMIAKLEEEERQLQEQRKAKLEAKSAQIKKDAEKQSDSEMAQDSPDEDEDSDDNMVLALTSAAKTSDKDEPKQGGLKRLRKSG